MSLWKRRTFPRVNKNGVKIRTATQPRDLASEEGTELAGVTAVEHCESSSEWVYEVVTSMARLGIILGYFFLCDR